MKIKKIFGRFINSVLVNFGFVIHTVRSHEVQIKKTDEDVNYRNIFLSPWTDSWKDFYVKNLDIVNSLLDKLKSGMDEKSKKVIDTFWEKMIFLVPYNKYKKSFLYKVSDFFTTEEIEAQKQINNWSEYKFPNSAKIEFSVFTNKNGLAFLEDKITSKIRGKAVIDGGAYIGDSALSFLEYKPSCIYSFEPVDSLYKKMVETINLNRIEKLVEPVRLGLGSIEGKSIIYGKDSGASLYRSEKGELQDIRITTIDNFVKVNKLNVGLIKLDIEGSELEAIHGAMETIKKHRPILLVSVYHRPEDFFYIKPLIENLDLGYKFMIRKTSPFRVTSETVLICYVYHDPR